LDDALVAVREGGVNCGFTKIRIEDALENMADLLAEVKRLREEQKQIHDLLTEVLPRKDGTPHMRVTLWGLESELKRVVSEIAIILGMVESEEE